jgi:hypothetical protein
MRQNNANCSIICSSDYGPMFGSGYDICICNNSNTTTGSYLNMGNSNQHPQPSQGASYIAGSYQFHLSEIEVFYKE